jgi:hypothetical protein
MKKEEFSVKKVRYISKNHISKERLNKKIKKKHHTRERMQLE